MTSAHPAERSEENMTGLHVGLVLTLIAALVRQSAPPAPADAAIWPIPGVVSQGTAGVTAPRLIKDVKPNYTADAMRAKIQGLVGLEGVVEPDGSVGPVRIVRSLDAVYGLDDEAIRTVKKWRFVPGMKDGAPVRVAVTIEMAFTLRDSRRDPPTPIPPTPILGWPDSFSDKSEVPASLPAGWLEDSIETSTLDLRVAYPPGWSLRRYANAQTLAGLVADDARGHRSITISQPGPAPFDLTTPLPEARLKEFLEGVGKMHAAQTLNVRMVQSGQIRSSGRLWLWLEMAAPTDLPRAPEAIAAHMRAAHDGMRMWSFTTTAGGQSIQVFCSVLHAANTSDTDKQEEIRRAGLEFGGMLKRFSMATR
jgi:TonB family protein